MNKLNKKKDRMKKRENLDTAMWCPTGLCGTKKNTVLSEWTGVNLDLMPAK